jgi:hypothetical protein
MSGCANFTARCDKKLYICSPAIPIAAKSTQIMRLIALYILLCLILTSCSKSEPATEKPAAAAPAADVAGAAAAGTVKPLHERPIKYTYKAFCQMRCNRYTTQLVKQAIKDGKIKTKNKWLERKPCPLYAVEYPLPENQKLYLVIAACDEVTKVVRVFDTRRKPCNCDQAQPPAKK